MKLAWALALLVVGANLSVDAQSNKLLDEILDSPAVTYGQAAYLVLTAVNKLPDSATPAEAADELWKVDVRNAEETIDLGEYSLLLMKAFRLSGGLFYRLLPVPRYAARELAWRGWIAGSTYPGRSLSGVEAVRLLGNAIEVAEDR